VSVSRLAAIRQVLAAAHDPRQSDAHTISPACERRLAATGTSGQAPPVSVGRLAAIQQVLAAWPRPRHPDAHTIGPACERQPPGCDPAGAAIPGARVPPFARAAFTGGSRGYVHSGLATACERNRLVATPSNRTILSR